MIFTETKLKGAFIVDIKKIEDERGFFARCWCKNAFEEHGLNAHALQANVSVNRKKATLRGMHFQFAPFAETKTIRCTSGAIYDVILDIRPESETYLEWIGVELTAASCRMLYIPEGFAHGFITLMDNTAVHYVVTAPYTPEAEGGIRFDDPVFSVDWPIPPAVVSEKDLKHKPFVPQIQKSPALVQTI